MRYAIRDKRLAKGLLGIILLVYFAIAAQYAARTPDWQAPDEPAHYNYIRYVVEHSALPVLRFGDYDQAYLERFTSPASTPDMSIDPLRYEFHQPPLYYLLAAPVYALTGGDLLAMRMMSVALGGALIAVTYLVVCAIKPDRPDLALGTAAFVAFVPQHVAMMSSVNNDSLAELLLALILLQTFRVVKAGKESELKELLVLGVLLGLGLVTKTTDYLAVPIVLVALLLPALHRQPRNTQHATRNTYHMLLVFAPALLIGSLWWFRNINVYGDFDVLGLQRHGAVVAGQPLTAGWIASMGFGPFLLGALTKTFHSFWGQFGWMGVPMPEWVYLGLGVLSLIALAGWLLPVRPRRPVSHAAILLTLLVFFTFAAYIWYNLTFVQHQGRYLFPALIPLGLGFSIGIACWTRVLPRPIGILVYVGVFAGLAALCVLALYRFVIPALSV
ncbi:MAG TPA: DUF2142 domain-containing protein [Anaerolineae bacterium]|nr:DUF2142 domain-containing protein [Anaerolineae bacterium]